MASPFESGFMAGLEQQRMQTDATYKKAVLERLKKEGELQDIKIRRELEAEQAPTEFLGKLNTPTMTEGPAAPVLPTPDYSPDTVDAVKKIGGEFAPGVTLPASESGMSPKDILATSVALPETKLGVKTPEELHANYLQALAKAPDKAQVLGAIATSHPILGPFLQKKALDAEQAKKELELGLKKKEKTFDTDEQIRAENAKSANEMTRLTTGKSADYLTKINENKTVLVSDTNNPEIKIPWDVNANQAMVVVKPVDPNDPKKGTVMVPNPEYNKQGNTWKIPAETVKGMLKQNPDLAAFNGKVPKTEQEFDVLATGIAGNPSHLQTFMQRYQTKIGQPGGAQQAGQAAQGGAGAAAPTQQASTSGGGLVDKLKAAIGIGGPAPTASAEPAGPAGIVEPKTKDKIREDLIRGGSSKTPGTALEKLAEAVGMGGEVSASRNPSGAGGSIMTRNVPSAEASVAPSSSTPPQNVTGLVPKPAEPPSGKVITGTDLLNAVLPEKDRIGGQASNAQPQDKQKARKEFLESIAPPGSEARKQADAPKETDTPKEKLSRASDLFLGSLRKSTTVGRVKGDLKRAFPDLSDQQIAKMLDPVTHKAGAGSGLPDMVDLEKLRDNIDGLYEKAVK